jgi:hypothetical protein
MTRFARIIFRLQQYQCRVSSEPSTPPLALLSSIKCGCHRSRVETRDLTGRRYHFESLPLRQKAVDSPMPRPTKAMKTKRCRISRSRITRRQSYTRRPQRPHETVYCRVDGIWYSRSRWTLTRRRSQETILCLVRCSALELGYGGFWLLFQLLYSILMVCRGDLLNLRKVV